MPEIIDPVFAKTSQNARFLLSENERFGLVFVKTGSINSGTGRFQLENKLKMCVIFFILSVFINVRMFGISCLCFRTNGGLYNRDKITL